LTLTIDLEGYLSIFLRFLV